MPVTVEGKDHGAVLVEYILEAMAGGTSIEPRSTLICRSCGQQHFERDAANLNFSSGTAVNLPLSVDGYFILFVVV